MSEHQQVQDQLLQRRADLQERISRIRGDFASGHSSDSQEQAQERENDETLTAIEREAAEELSQVDAALARLRDGQYGVCENCGAEIDSARLRAIPQTILCIHCAQGASDAR